MEEEEKKEEVKQSISSKKGSNKIVFISMGIIIVALVVVVLVLLLGGKGNKNSNNEETNSEQNVENNNNVVEETIEELKFGNYACGGVNYSFSKKTVTVDEISPKEKLAMLATVLSELINTENITAGEDIELDIDIYELAQKYFDITPEMEKQMEEGFENGFYVFSYKNKKSYVNLIIGGCIGPSNEGNYVKYKESKREGNTLISTYYYFYKKNLDEPVVIGNDNGYDITTFPSSYYKDKSDSKPLYSDVVSDDIVDFEKFDTYDLYFDVSNGNMKLTKIVYNSK